MATTLPPSARTISEPPDLEEPVMGLWAEYSKDRYLAAEEQIKEYRTWGRQLGTAVGVLIGLEMTVVVKGVFDPPDNFTVWHALGLASILLAAVVQVMMLSGVILTGYVGQPIEGPGSPLKLRLKLPALIGSGVEGKRQAEDIIGRFYANAYVSHYKLNQQLALKLKKQARWLIGSLVGFLLGIALLGTGAMVIAATKASKTRSPAGVPKLVKRAPVIPLRPTNIPLVNRTPLQAVQPSHHSP